MHEVTFPNATDQVELWSCDSHLTSFLFYFPHLVLSQEPAISRQPLLLEVHTE